MRRLALLCLALLAGCLDAAGPEAVGAGPGPGAPEALRYACGGALREERAEGLCVLRLASARESYQEPVVAVHPRDPAVMAVAVILGETTGAATESALPAVSPARLGLLASEDGGASWRLARVPLAQAPSPLGPLALVNAGDPSIVFDERGTLHLAGMATSASGVRGSQIFHASTADLGATWSSPVVLAGDADNDREWISMPRPGLLVVAWQNLGSSVEYAWSTDGGASWRAQDPATRPEGCGTVSPAVESRGLVLVACAGYRDGADAGLRVYALDLANASMRPLADLPSMPARWPALLRGPDGSLGLVADDRERGTVLLATSADGGATWSAPADLRERLGTEDSWATVQLYASATDASGRAHLLLKGSKRVLDATVGRVHHEPSLLHAAVEPASGRVLLEREVWPAARGAPPAPGSAAPGWSDDFGGIAFAGERALLAWSWEKGIDVAAVEPAPAPRG